MKIYENLQIIVKANGQPYGIRDDGGFLMVFPEVINWPDQPERFEQECKEQKELAALVVAAYDLLEAAKITFAWSCTRSESNRHWSNTDQVTHEILKAAIKKAKA